MSRSMPSSALKRIMCEVAEMQLEGEKPDAFFNAGPLENDFFEWHFTVRGPPDTPFDGGLYHGRIILPPEYPYKAPEILILTPNGRFEVNTPICLSITSHHQETWQPSWGIRTIITALVGFMPSKDQGIGSLQYSDTERRRLANKSHAYRCPQCAMTCLQLLPVRQTSPVEDLSTSTVSEPVQPTTPHATHEDNLEDDGFESDSGQSNTDQTQNHGNPNLAQEPPTTSSNAATRTVPAAQPTRLPPSQGDSLQPSATQISTSDLTQEKELLYIAYFIIFVMVGVVLRRVLASNVPGNEEL